jgi:crotonobetainyl-CoA:carnitine CoA-transferase CaiB-like acyl-CoA transferase
MIVPYEAFQTKDSWIVVACVTQKFWEGLCIGLGVEELIIDERFNSPGGRLKNHDDLIPILQNVFLKKTSTEWLQILDELEVPCAPVNSVDRALSDPQVLSRNMVVEFERDVVGKFKLVGNPIKTSATEDVFNPPPFLGEHTESILKELLGYSDEKIKQLNEEKAIGLMGQIPEEEEEEG